MEVTVTRKIFSGNSTIGEFSIDGALQCYSLEPKEKGKAPICVPFGRYQIQFRQEGTMFKNLCARFKDLRQERGDLHIFNIDGQSYPIWYAFPGITDGADVLIHCGNYPHDTLGCCLVALEHGIDELTPRTSEAAYRIIYPLIADALERGEDVFITYLDGREAAA